MSKLNLNWEDIHTTTSENGIVNLRRFPVIGGWIINMTQSIYPADYTCLSDLLFLPDPNHEWTIDKGV